MTADRDVIVVGDGPAGAAAASACRALGLDVVVVGPGEPWRNTYGTWLDDVPDLPDEVFAASREQVVVVGTELRRIDRAYGVLDNIALRAHLGLEALLRPGSVVSIESHGDRALVALHDGDVLAAQAVVDARGAGAEPGARGWQTAYGIVVDELTACELAATDTVSLMDWSWSGSLAGDTPSFLYVVPLADGWLVEHTVLAAMPAVDPGALRDALVDRLGAAVVESAERAGRCETVRIPMGVPVRRGSGRVVPFGAAAGMLHPATGYSVAASLRAAPRLAQAIAAGADAHEAVWPTPARRARALHDYGLEALLRLGPEATAEFFEAFFELPVPLWREYLRVDTTAVEVARSMSAVFRRVPWSVRGRLARPDPRLVARLLRP